METGGSGVGMSIREGLSPQTRTDGHPKGSERGTGEPNEALARARSETMVLLEERARDFGGQGVIRLSLTSGPVAFASTSSRSSRGALRSSETTTDPGLSRPINGRRTHRRRGGRRPVRWSEGGKNTYELIEAIPSFIGPAPPRRGVGEAAR